MEITNISKAYDLLREKFGVTVKSEEDGSIDSLAIVCLSVLAQKKWPVLEFDFNKDTKRYLIRNCEEDDYGDVNVVGFGMADRMNDAIIDLFLDTFGERYGS